MMLLQNNGRVQRLITTKNIYRAQYSQIYLVKFYSNKMNHYRKLFYDFEGRNVLTLSL